MAFLGPVRRIHCPRTSLHSRILCPLHDVYQKVTNVILILDFARDICRATAMIILPNPYFDILFQDRPGKLTTRVQPDAVDNSALSIQVWLTSSQDVSLCCFSSLAKLCGVNFSPIILLTYPCNES